MQRKPACHEQRSTGPPGNARDAMGGVMGAGQPTVPREVACPHHNASGYQLTVRSTAKRCLALMAEGALSSWPSRRGAPKPM